MKCALKVEEEAKYLVEPGVEPYPILPIRIFREELKKTISTDTLMDTGFDGAIILSRSLCDFILDRGVKADGFEELDAAGIGIPCDTCILHVYVGGRWFKAKAHMPRMGDLGTILGRRILNRLTLCLRGPRGRVFLAKS
ncbi:MAG: hypothetical protein ACE5Z5_15100 [Candidatus Bathyarchaeia archaeon]